MHTSTITLRVQLNDERIPEGIEWESDDSPEGQEPLACKAMLLSLFDRDHRDTLRIDLWTKDMQVGEMDRFMYHTLRGMVDSYYSATQNKDMANAFRHFVQFFGEQTEILPKSS